MMENIIIIFSSQRKEKEQKDHSKCERNVCITKEEVKSKKAKQVPPKCFIVPTFFFSLLYILISLYTLFWLHSRWLFFLLSCLSTVLLSFSVTHFNVECLFLRCRLTNCCHQTIIKHQLKGRDTCQDFHPSRWLKDW